MRSSSIAIKGTYTTQDPELERMKNLLQQINYKNQEMRLQMQLVHKAIEDLEKKLEEDVAEDIKKTKNELNAKYINYIENHNGNIFIIENLDNVTDFLKFNQQFVFTSSALMQSSLLDYALTLYNVEKTNSAGITTRFGTLFSKKTSITREFRETLNIFLKTANDKEIKALDINEFDAALIKGNFAAFIEQYKNKDKQTMSVYEIAQISRCLKVSKDMYKNAATELKEIIGDIKNNLMSFSQHSLTPKTACIIIADDGQMSWNRSSMLHQHNFIVQEKLFDAILLYGCGSYKLDASKIYKLLEAVAAKLVPLELDQVVVKIMAHGLKIATPYVDQIEKMVFGPNSKIIYLINGYEIEQYYNPKLNNKSYLITHGITNELNIEKDLAIEKFAKWIKYEKDLLKGILRCYAEFDENVAQLDSTAPAHNVVVGNLEPQGVKKFYEQLLNVKILDEDLDNPYNIDQYKTIELVNLGDSNAKAAL
jgi:hypothetical protein